MASEVRMWKYNFIKFSSASNADKRKAGSFTIKNAATMLIDKTLDLYPKIQRRSESWSLAKRERFIDSIMLGKMNLGPIILRYDSKTKKYSMLDGSHRMSTIWRDFLEDKIMWHGKYWSEFSASEQRKFYKNAVFLATVYKDITDGEAAQIFREANAGVHVVEAESYNATSGELGDIMRSWTRPLTPKLESEANLPEYVLQYMGQQNLFNANAGLGKAWILRHEHEMIALMFLHEAYYYVVKGFNVQTSGSGNSQRSREQLYWRYDLNKKALEQGRREWEEVAGKWQVLSEKYPTKALQVLKRATDNMEVMHRLLQAGDPKNLGATKSAKKPGKLFWNLFHFWLGLQIEYPNIRIKDYKKFVSNYVRLDNYLSCDENGNKITSRSHSTPYSKLAGGWTPTDIKDRNGHLFNGWPEREHSTGMRKGWTMLGNFDAWGIYGTTPPKVTNKQRRLMYIDQDGKCAITNVRCALEDMHAHHLNPVRNNGARNISNLILISAAAHREMHAAT
jgi:5-methylcytosine-specific restriction endonuclease McrA